MNIIDLSVFENTTLDFKLPDGRIIKISKPTQKMVIEILKFKDISEKTSANKIINSLNKVIWQILNANDEAVQVTQDYVKDDLNMQMKLAIIKAYSGFIEGLQNQKN